MKVTLLKLISLALIGANAGAHEPRGASTGAVALADDAGAEADDKLASFPHLPHEDAEMNEVDAGEDEDQNNRRGASNNRRGASNNRRGASNNRRGGSNNRRGASNNRRPASNNRRPASNNRRPASNNRRPASNNRRPASNNRRPAAGNRRPAGSNHVRPQVRSCIRRCKGRKRCINRCMGIEDAGDVEERVAADLLGKEDVGFDADEASLRGGFEEQVLSARARRPASFPFGHHFLAEEDDDDDDDDAVAECEEEFMSFGHCAAEAGGDVDCLTLCLDTATAGLTEEDTCESAMEKNFCGLMTECSNANCPAECADEVAAAVNCLLAFEECAACEPSS